MCLPPSLLQIRVYMYINLSFLIEKWGNLSVQMGKFVDLGIQICQFI